MILDNEIVIISDEKAFVLFDKNDGEDSTKMVGPYAVGDLLGKGGFGEVYIGTNTISGQKVALKFINKRDIQTLLEAERAALEYQVLSSLNHRNIIKLHSVSS